MKKSGLVVGVFVCLFLMAVITEVKANDVGEKALLGFSNTVAGWTDALAEPARGAAEGNIVERIFGFFAGIPKGIAKAAIRTGSGPVDLVLSPLPPDNIVGTYPIVDDHL